MKLLITIFILIISICSFAKEERFYLKMKMERDLEQDISDKLNTVLAKELFTIKANVSFITETKKGFNLNRYQATPLVKFDVLDDSYMKSIEKANRDGNDLKIGKISVFIYLANSVSDKNTEIVKKLITTTYSSFGKLKIDYQFNKFEKILKRPKTLFERMQQYSSLLGIAVFALLFLALGIGAIYKFYKMGKLTLSAMDQIMVKIEQSAYDSINNAENQKKIEEKEKETSEVAADLMNIKFAKFEGTKRFLQFFAKHPEKACIEIKKWFFADSKIPQYATSLIIRSMDIEMLNSFMVYFDDIEKKKLKGTLTLKVSSDSYYLADNFIVESLTRLVLEPGMVDDDLYTQIISQPKETLLEIINNNQQTGAYLLAILPKTLSDELLANVDTETFNNIMNNSLDFSKKELNDQIQGLKNAFKVSKISSVEKQLNPILNDATDLLYKSSVDKENSLFDVLSSTLNREKFEKVAIKHFPYNLFDKIPDDLVKQALIAMDSSSRSQYLAILEEDQRDKYFNLMGDVKSKLREMVQLDVDKILNKFELLEDAKKFYETNHRLFIKATRGVMANNMNLPRTKKLLADWIESNYHQIDEKNQDNSQAA